MFLKKFAICLLLQRQQDKHIITSQGLDCVPGSNFTGMWCKTTTPPKRYIYNITLKILNRVTTGMNYTIDNRCRVFGFSCPFTPTFKQILVLLIINMVIIREYNRMNYIFTYDKYINW